MIPLAAFARDSGPARAAVVPPLSARARPMHALDAEDWIAWWALSDAAGDANPFAAPWFVGTSLAHLDPARAVRLLVVIDAAGSWIGMLPIGRAVRIGRLPFRHWAAWSHSNQFLGGPLVRPGAEASFWRTALIWLDAHGGAAAALRITGLPADAPATAALLDVAREQGRPLLHLAAHSRAVRLHAPERPREGASPADRPAGGKARARLRALRRNLERDHGPVSVVRCTEPNASAWIARFIAMERSGWKGAAGSAIASTRAVGDFFRDTVASAYDAGRCDLVALRAGGRDVAMSIQFVGPRHAYGFKRCYDEAFARYAPGRLLLESIEAMAGDAPPRLFDSCCTPDERSVNAVWPQRREIMDLCVALGGTGGRARFALFTTARRAWLMLKRLVRAAPAASDPRLDVERHR